MKMDESNQKVNEVTKSIEDNFRLETRTRKI